MQAETADLQLRAPHGDAGGRGDDKVARAVRAVAHLALRAMSLAPVASWQDIARDGEQGASTLRRLDRLAGGSVAAVQFGLLAIEALADDGRTVEPPKEPGLVARAVLTAVAEDRYLSDAHLARLGFAIMRTVDASYPGLRRATRMGQAMIRHLAESHASQAVRAEAAAALAACEALPGAHMASWPDRFRVLKSYFLALEARSEA